jgi:dGTPase
MPQEPLKGPSNRSTSVARRPMKPAGPNQAGQGTMSWPSLLQSKRLRRSSTPSPDGASGRSAFDRDYDRIVFSTAFRRLHGKTQVFPLPETDMTHTRLTHSIEVSCVGRSLGALVGEKLEGEGIDKHDVAAIVAAACLAHDIGNPPFGHSGEDAVQAFFSGDTGKRHTAKLSDAQRADLENYDGNAAGFRLLTYTRPAQSSVAGGLNLTLPTLAAFTKYPRLHGSHKHGERASHKKVGLLQASVEQYGRIANELGLLPSSHGAWCRHPLAFLVEAADDICYSIMDLEDGFKLGLVSFDEVRNLLEPIIDNPPLDGRGEILTQIRDPRERVGYLRAIVIDALVRQVAGAFADREKEIRCGTFDRALSKEIPAEKALVQIKTVSREKVYAHEPVLQIEASGYEVLPALLDIFLSGALVDKPTAREKKHLSLIPSQYLDRDRKAFEDPYHAILSVVDYVCSMTDAFAIETYRVLKGIQLPRGAAQGGTRLPR